MIVSLLNQKGGVGKTTLAVNLARYFYKKNQTTLLVDSDPQGSALSWYERSNGELLDMVCLSIASSFQKDLRMFTKDYSHIFIDGVPSLSPVTIAAIKVSDIVLIPVQPSPYDIWASEEIVRLVRDRQEITDNELKSAFVVCRKIVGTNLARDVDFELKKQGIHTFTSNTCQRIAYATSVQKGSTVVDGEYYKSEAYKEIESICLELEEFYYGVDQTA